jgi:hypothetical protein
MGPKIYVLDSQKIVAFATKQVRGNEKLHKGRDLFSFIMPPRAMIAHRGIYYLPTKIMSPQTAAKEQSFDSPIDLVSIDLHAFLAGWRMLT